MDSPELRQRISANIKKLRKERSLSQFELAEKADLSEQTINSIESRRLWPSDKTFAKIADALQTDVFYFFLPNSKSGYGSTILPDEIRQKIIESIEELVKTTFESIKKDSAL